MVPTSPETKDLIRKQINEQVDLIDRVIRKMRKNQVVDLKSMEAKMNILCFRIDRLDDEELKDFEPFIALLNGKLRELEEELMALQKRMDIKVPANYQTESDKSGANDTKSNGKNGGS